MNAVGVLLIDKPAGKTSFDVIRQLRRVLNIRKLGHTGTLDPFATGLLPVLIGPATRYADYLSFADKTYEVTMEIGTQTDTGDITGTIIAQHTPPPFSQDACEAAARQMQSLTEQTPPRYSAIKIKGKRAYELARAGVEFTLPPRPVTIHQFSITHIDYPRISYIAHVSKGTYIRTLSEDFAAAMNTCATTTALRRTTIGGMQIADAIALDAITPENWQQHVVPLNRILLHYPQIELTDEELQEYRHGRRFSIEASDTELCVVVYQQRMAGLATIADGIVHPKKVLI
jgi:tRNA pseudouridine55 synthase